MADYDVAVVGAGVHGVSAAYHLARQGVATIVVERGYPADGPTTGRSSAICRAYYTNRFLAAVARDAMATFADFAAVVGGDAGYHRTGALFLHSTDEIADVERTVTDLVGIGVGVDLLEPAELARRHPDISLDGVGLGVWEAEAGYADPVLTTRSLLDAARAAGADVRIRAPVERIDPGPEVQLSMAGGESLRARRVLVAAGPWTRSLVAPLGVDLPVRTERHVVTSYRCGADAPPYVVADTVTGWYGKPELGGLYLVGGLHPAPVVNPDAFAERAGDDEVLTYADLLIARFPRLADAAPAGGWAGIYDVSPDWQPIIGEVAPGVVVDCGSSGHGFKLAPALGQYVAALAVGDDVPELRPFHPDRFGRGERLAAGFGESQILG